jgi:hypothetical protein
MGDLLPAADMAYPDFRRMLKGLPDDGGGFAVGRQRDSPSQIHRTRSSPRPSQSGWMSPLARSSEPTPDWPLVNALNKNRFGIGPPVKRAESDAGVRGNVFRFAPRDGNRVDIPADRSFIAHQPADESDGGSVGRPPRVGNLHGRLQNGFGGGSRDIDDGQLGDVPIVVAGAVRGGNHQLRAVRRPIVFVDVKVQRRKLTHRPGFFVDQSEPLLVNIVRDYPHRGSFRDQRAGGTRSVLREEQGDGFAIGRPFGKS